MLTVTMEQANAQFDSLIESARHGEEIIVSEPGKSAIVIKSAPQAPQFGSGKGLITYMAEDFDAPLDEMKEYME